MSSNPLPPKRRYNRQEDVLEQLMKAFPGSKIVDPITWEPTNHRLNVNAVAPKKKRRRKRDPGKGQGGLF